MSGITHIYFFIISSNTCFIKKIPVWHPLDWLFFEVEANRVNRPSATGLCPAVVENLSWSPVSAIVYGNL